MWAAVRMRCAGVGAVESRYRRERVVSRGDTPASAPPLLPEVTAVTTAWVPHSVQDADPTVLAAVMPVVRCLVAAVGPGTPMAARRLLWALAPIAVWCRETVGSFTALTINPRNVEVWVMEVNGRRPQGWRNAARAALRQVGRSVNPQKWSDPPEQVGRPRACAAYDPVEEAGFVEAVGLPGADEPVLRLWVGAASCGAGMRGPEIGAAETGDLHEVRAGRLAVQVRGRDARLAPIRACWTDAVRQAVQFVAERPGTSTRFFVSQDRNAAARAANSVSIGHTNLSLRRARATWLTAHIVAETPLLVLRKIAGPLSAATLDDLLAAADVSITPEQAVIKGLRA